MMPPIQLTTQAQTLMPLIPKPTPGLMPNRPLKHDVDLIVLCNSGGVSVLGCPFARADCELSQGYGDEMQNVKLASSLINCLSVCVEIGM